MHELTQLIKEDMRPALGVTEPGAIAYAVSKAKSYVPGELKIFNEYLSSSTEVYDDSFQIQYVIQSKNGRDIGKYNSTEKEILFERGSSFIVTRVDGHTIYMEEL